MSKTLKGNFPVLVTIMKGEKCKLSAPIGQMGRVHAGYKVLITYPAGHLIY